MTAAQFVRDLYPRLNGAQVAEVVRLYSGLGASIQQADSIMGDSEAPVSNSLHDLTMICSISTLPMPYDLVLSGVPSVIQGGYNYSRRKRSLNSY